VVRGTEASGLTGPVFLFDEDLIAHGKALHAIYPQTIHVASVGDAPPRRTPDGGIYRWCLEHGAILVTADFNMLRDQAILSELLGDAVYEILPARRRQSAD
jgi:hypothetical protein